MKLISWNVNGLRACMNKGFMEYLEVTNADVFCVQETKLQKGQEPFNLKDYHEYWNYADKKGYSGTAIFSKKKPINITYGLGVEEHDHEGRIITLEFEDFYMITSYIPNSQRELTRLDYRMRYENTVREYLHKLDEIKPVIFCGDLNVAHNEIDLKNPKTNRHNAGFTDEERKKFTELLETGFVDTYRYLYPNKIDAYTWWSYMANAREKNIGWRIDYFCISDRITDKLKTAEIYPDIMGSDHCPIGIEIDL